MDESRRSFLMTTNFLKMIAQEKMEKIRRITKTALDEMLDELIPWIKEQVEHGNI